MIVIPTYNEAENIEELVKKIRSVMPTERILFVDDNSPDGTAGVIRSLQQKDPNVDLIVRTGKKGFAASYIEGFREALQKNAEYIVMMDADTSHPAEKIPQMVELLLHADAIIGSRYVKGGSTPHWNIFRMLLSKFGNIYAKLFAGLKVKDMTSGFMVMKSSALEKIQLSTFKAEGYAFQMDLKNKLHQTGAMFTEIAITFSERPKGKSKFSLSTLTEGIVFPLKMLWQRILRMSVLVKGGWLVFLFSFLIYFLTAPRTIFFGDNAEFITAVDVLGVPHPSGYPLYIILAKIFSLLPLGNIVLEVNLFSAFCASLSLALIYLLALKCARSISWFFKKTFTDKVIAYSFALATFGFGLTTIFWYQAIVGKIYPLNLLILLSICLFSFKFFETKQVRFVYLGALFFGLGFSNHQTIVLFFPVFLILLLLQKANREVLLKSKTILLTAISFISGFLPYVYLPLASLANPPLDWGNTGDSVSNWLNHIKRTHYQDLAQSFSVSDKLKFIADFAINIFNQLHYFLLFALAGMYALLKSAKKVFFLSFGIITISGLGIILLRSLPYSIEASEFYSTYYLPAYAFAFLFLLTGIYICCLALKKHNSLVLVALSVVFFGFFLATNFNKTNFSNFKFVDEYSQNVFKGLTENSVLVFGVNNASEDTALFALGYQKYVKAMRPDVHVLAYPHTFKQHEPQKVNEIYTEEDISKQNESLVDYALEHFKGKNIYTTFIVSSDKYTARSNGFVYRIFKVTDSPRVGPMEPQEISKKDLNTLINNYSGRELLKTYYLSQAAVALQQGEAQRAHEYFIEAIALSHDPSDQQLKEYIKLREGIKGNENR